MHIAILTFEGFNELDSLIALGILNRVKKPGWKVSIACPSDEARSMNGVVLKAQATLEDAAQADAVIVGSGMLTREVVADQSLMARIRLDPARQLLAAQCSGTLVLAKLGLLRDVPACTDLTTKPWVEEAGVRTLDQPFVSEVEQAPTGAIPPERANEPAVLRHLREIHAELDERPLLELYQEALHHVAEGQTLYALGQLSLADRARLDDLFYAIVTIVRRRLKPEERAHRQAIDELDLRLVDKYFVNFSVFESIPDVWAIDQVFPIVPLTRLDEEPTRRGVIGDLTCDSDGRIDQYVEEDGLDVSLPLHELRPGESYRLGIFMVGAYQETLGDIHNLFGDTDAVNVRVDGDSYVFAHKRRGDTTDLMLDYVGYDLEALRRSYRERIAAAGVEGDQAEQLFVTLNEGLTGYTYLSEGVR